MDYKITKKKIKNYIIRIYPDKTIKISVPLNAKEVDIKNFIKNKKEWIEKTLDKFEEKSNVINKNSMMIFGKNREKKFIKSSDLNVRLSENNVFIYHNFISNDDPKIEKYIMEWKLNNLKNLLEEYLNKYFNILNVSIKMYKIKKMKSAWGIYHIKKNYITFNSLLIEKEKECIEYVVLHELCHIFYPNHQREFWDLVKKHMHFYEEYRKRLKQ